MVPSVLTALAFVVLSHFGAVGDLPLWVLLTLLALMAVLGEVTGGLVGADARPLAMHAGLALQILSVST